MIWLKENLTLVKWIFGIIIWFASLFGTYTKMKYDIEDIKKDMDRANIIELKADVEAIKNTNDQIKSQLNIIIETLLNN